MKGAMIGRRLPQLFCLALVSLMVLSSGCAYVHDRVNDLTDIGGVKILAGRGARVAASFNNEKAIGVGYYDFRKYGWDGRSFGVWADSGQDAVVNAERDFEALRGTAGAYCLETEILGSRDENHDHILPAMTFRNVGDVQLTLAAMLGVEVNVSPLQILDFVLGWVCFDIGDDDCHWGKKNASWIDDHQHGHTHEEAAD